jgi:hypothetical protein
MRVWLWVRRTLFSPFTTSVPAVLWGDGENVALLTLVAPDLHRGHARIVNLDISNFKDGSEVRVMYERYVLAVSPEDLPVFEAVAQRERAPYSVVGTATEEERSKAVRLGLILVAFRFIRGGLPNRTDIAIRKGTHHLRSWQRPSTVFSACPPWDPSRS